MDTPIKISPTPVEEKTKISLTPPATPKPIVDPAQIQVEANKIKFALDTEAVTYDDITLALYEDNEQRLRDQAALEERTKLETARMELVNNVIKDAAAQGRNVSPEETIAIREMTDADLLESAVNPATVFEKKYARRMTDIAASFNSESPVLKSLGTESGKTILQKKHFEDVISRREIAEKANFRAKQAYESQSWFGWSVDQAKAIAPGYLWWKWNSLNAKDVEGILPGTEKRALYEEIYSLPVDQMQVRVKELTDYLTQINPSLAQEFTQGLISYTQSDEFYDNVLIAGVDLTALGIVAPVKGAAGAAKAAGRATTAGAIKAAEKFGAFSAQVSAEGAGAAAKETINKALASGGETFIRSGKFMANFTRAMLRPRADMSDGMDAIGETHIAAMMSYFKDTIPGAYDGMMKMTRNVPSIFNTAELFETGGKYLSKKNMEHIENTLKSQADLLVKKIFNDPIKSEVIDPGMLRAASEEIKDRLSRNISNAQQAILDVRLMDVTRNTPGNIRFAEVDMGDMNGSLFDTRAQADITAKIDFGLKDYTIHEVPGDKFVLRIKSAVNNTSLAYRDALEKYSTNNPTPLSNVLGQTLARWRTPDDLLPTEIVEAFNTVGYNMAGAKAAFSQIMENLGELKLSKESLADYDEFTRMMQTRVSRNDPDKYGDSPRNMLELEQEWFAKFNRPITEGEATLHWTMQQLNDIAYTGANIQQFVIRNRAGYSNWSFNGTRQGIIIDDIEGKQINELPVDLKNEVGILVIEDGPLGDVTNIQAVSYTGRKNRMANEVPKPERKRPDKPTKKELLAEQEWEEARKNLPSWDKKIKELQDQGYVIIQTSQYGASKLMQLNLGKGVLDDIADVRFIVAKTRSNKIIDPNIIPYTDGFRFMPNPKSVYIRQPIINMNEKRNTARYYGDRTLYQMNTEKEADDFLEKANKARKMFLEGALKETPNLKDFEEFVKLNFPGRMRKALRQDFVKGLRGENEGIDPRIPIVRTKVGQSTDNAFKLDDMVRNETGKLWNFERNRDITLGGYESLANMRPTLERGNNVWRMNNVGSPEKPIYEKTTPDLLNAREAVEQMTGMYLKSQFTDDVLYQTSERFVAEFGPVLDLDKISQFRDPIQAMIDETVFRQGLQGQDALKVNQARVFQERVKAFLGLRSDAQKEWNFMVNKFAGDITDKFNNPKSLVELLDAYNKGESAVTLLRNFAFHSKLGLFSPRQLFLQPMTMVTMAAKVGDLDVVRMTGSALWHSGVIFDRNLSRLLPEAEKALASSGWKKGWFSEAYDLYQRSGIDQVKYSNIYINDHLGFKVTKTKLGKFLFEDGLMFFNAGELMNRKAATMGAYLEWRKANPLAKLTEKQAEVILKRADLLNNNMGHQSRAFWQEGYKSIPTQFLGYTVRGMEQMIGKRLTKEEKIRVLGYHAAAFGVPLSIGSATGFIPLHDIYAEGAVAAGYDVNSNMISTIFSDGVLGMAAQILAGEPTNFSERFGPGGSSVIRDILFKDESFLEAVSGPGGQTFAGLTAEVLPVIPWMWNFLQGDETIRPRAILDVLSSQVTTLSQIEKAAAAVFAGAYYSKRGKDLLDTDRDAIQGIFEAAMGFDPKRVSQIYTMENVMREKQKMQRKLTPSMKQHIRDALDTTNPEDAKKSMEMLKIKGIMSGFTEEQMERMIKRETAGKTRRDDVLNRYEEMSYETNAFVQDMRKREQQNAPETGEEDTDG